MLCSTADLYMFSLVRMLIPLSSEAGALELHTSWWFDNSEDTISLAVPSTNTTPWAHTSHLPWYQQQQQQQQQQHQHLVDYNGLPVHVSCTLCDILFCCVYLFMLLHRSGFALPCVRAHSYCAVV
jgi:hypothetical protein